ncbi:MAG: c-type cytochrome [Hyphomicrobiales bacterium]|nr:c-type cytochrome [Hyphomicrobiales bacterium]
MALAISLTLAQAVAVQAADGKDIFLHGGGEAPTCTACHGASGEGQPDAGFPRLAGLNATYMEEQIKSFKEGTRKDDTMTPIAKALPEADRKAVAAYVSDLTSSLAPSEEKPDKDSIAKGAELAAHGDWPQGLAGCNQCHGPGGIGVGTVFPKLAGQSAAYIEKQLNDWKAGSRTNDPLALMAGVAKKLDDDQIKAVAAYYASRNPDGAMASETKEPAQ